MINQIFFRQKVRLYQWIALGLTYTGILVAFMSELYAVQKQPDIWLGSFFVVLCAVTFSIYIVGSGRQIPKTGSGIFTAHAMLAATAGVLLHFFIKNDFGVFPLSGYLWLYGIGLALFATVIPSFMISFGMDKIGSNNVAIILSIGPVSTILQAYFFLGEHISFLQMAGTVLVVFGVLMVGWRGK